MEQRLSASWRLYLLLFVLSVFWRVTLAQLKYYIREEQKEGAMVGNVAKDLDLDRRSLKGRGFRVVATTGKSLFHLNQDDGVLCTSGKLDREEVCERSSSCLINLKIALENPIEIHYVEVEVVDINDHAPIFPETEKRLEISENAVSGSRFQIQAARDQDSGMNSVQAYKISHNDYFRIEVKERGSDQKMPYLILQKSLDRETSTSHKLVLTALDGGKPPKSGTMEITIDVLDVNDNIPVFTKDSYSVNLSENVPIGTTIAQVNATDPDDGVNGEVFFIFGHNVDNDLRNIFHLDPVTGEIIVKGPIDFEQKDHYEIDIQASDKALAPLTADKSVLINIVDVNDNSPEIEVTSISSTIAEDSKLGTTVALISVSDVDSGLNAKVSLFVLEEIPFSLMQTSQHNIYSLITASLLDREKITQYVITLVAQDAGQPALSSFKSISVQLSDVNDNIPEFSSNPYIFYVPENNIPGMSVFSVSASDCDLGENARITYQLWRDTTEQSKYRNLLNINPENGEIYALKSFDFEVVKAFNFLVVATDSGNPSLSSNVTVNVFILDQNDNVPVILYPVRTNGSFEGVEEIPRNVNPGHLVTKVKAYDVDIGYNGWLLFSLQEVSAHGLFVLDRYTGQIRTLRSFTEIDKSEEKLVILVKDNGNVSLSATATVIIKLVEPKELFSDSNVKSAVKDEGNKNIIFYLIITLGSVSVLFIISITVLIAMHCSKSIDYSSKYLQDTAYDGTLCHSIQYRSGEKQYTLVDSRMSIGSPIVPGSNGNTLLVQNHRMRTSREVSNCSL